MCIDLNHTHPLPKFTFKIGTFASENQSQASRFCREGLHQNTIIKKTKIP